MSSYDPRDVTAVSAFASGTSAVSIVTAATSFTGSRMFVSHISGFSDLTTASLQLLDGSTVVWQTPLQQNVPYGQNFTTPIPVSDAHNVQAKVTTGSLKVGANLLLVKRSKG